VSLAQSTPDIETQPRPPVVAVVGATGTGKSALALSLAAALAESGQPVEIVNADAMQLYRGMDIGTAKLPVDQRGGIVHHLLDVWEVTKEASVADYQATARATILEILSRGVIPLMVGGSGLYVSSVLYEFEFPGTDKAIRESLEARWEAEGPDALVEELRAKDPLAAAAIDPKNARRVIRALEVIALTGKPFGAGLDAEHRPWYPRTVVMGLRSPREQLVERLDDRVRAMWSAGLVDEVRGLIPQGIESGVTASRAIGYQQCLSFLAGSLSEEEAIEETQALTRRYARRQVSWFGRSADTHWIESDDPGATTKALGFLATAG
jgi:tRNA dimethylallyltransferase